MEDVEHLVFLPTKICFILKQTIREGFNYKGGRDRCIKLLKCLIRIAGITSFWVDRAEILSPSCQPANSITINTENYVCVLSRVGNSLICSSLFCLKLLILNSNHERFSHVALYKRATLRDLLTLFFTKERHERCEYNLLENFVFFVCFWKFSPFLIFMPIALCSYPLF